MESQYDERPEDVMAEVVPETVNPGQYEEVYQMADEPVSPKKNNMALVSLIMGILSLALGCCCMGTIFGGLAVLFACLSKTDGVMDTKAKAGLITGILGILLTAGMFIFIMASGGSNAIDYSMWYDMVKIITDIRYLA